MFDVADIVPWAKAFVFTELVEAPIYRVGARASWSRALGASAITHPFVWFVFPALGERVGTSYVTTTALSELFAWVVEAAFLVWSTRRAPAGIGWRRALVVSLLANGASVALGLTVRTLFGVV